MNKGMNMNRLDYLRNELQLAFEEVDAARKLGAHAKVINDLYKEVLFYQNQFDDEYEKVMGFGEAA
jgi:hypothetical protein